MYRNLASLPTYDNNATFVDFVKTVFAGGAISDASVVAIRVYSPDLPNAKPISDISGTMFFYRVISDAIYAKFITSSRSTTNKQAINYETYIARDDNAALWCGWKRIIDDSSAQTISGVKTFTASPIVPTTPSGASAAVNKTYADLKVALAGAQTITGVKTFATGATPLITDAPTTDLMAVNKEYADNLIPYDKVIRTQTEFEELIASETWLGAVSVALVGQFTLSTANNSGIKVPDTVKQIHGFNSAKITVTNFVYNSSTAKGGLWYDTLSAMFDYSIRDLEVDCTGDSGSLSYGFLNCRNLTNCIGTGTGTGRNGYGFYGCSNLTNCKGTGTGSNGHGFRYCTNLTNCTGKGISTGEGAGYGFSNIDYASNCRDGGSTTDKWGDNNYNIDVETCRYSPVEANNTILNT